MNLPKTARDNWELNGDCLNLLGDLTQQDLREISGIPTIRVIQPWKFMPSEKTWLALNEAFFSARPEVRLHIWADTLKSDFLFLGKMEHLQNLDLNQVKFTNKATLASINQLRKLKLINGNLRELAFLENFPYLEELEIGRIKGLNDILFISKLKALRTLDINHQTQIVELPDFSALPVLKSVSLITLANLKEIGGLAAISGLEELSFHGLHREVAPEQFGFLRDMKKLKMVRAHFPTKEKRLHFTAFLEQLGVKGAE